MNNSPDWTEPLITTADRPILPAEPAPITGTPRTDAELMRLMTYADGSFEFQKNQNGTIVPADFARTLETELAAVTAERDEAREKFAKAEAAIKERDTALEYGQMRWEKRCDNLRATLARLVTAADGMENKLIEIRDMPEYDQDDQYRLREKAKAALSAYALAKQEAGV